MPSHYNPTAMHTLHTHPHTHTADLLQCLFPTSLYWALIHILGRKHGITGVLLHHQLMFHGPTGMCHCDWSGIFRSLPHLMKYALLIIIDNETGSNSILHTHFYLYLCFPVFFCLLQFLFQVPLFFLKTKHGYKYGLSSFRIFTQLELIPPILHHILKHISLMTVDNITTAHCIQQASCKAEPGHYFRLGQTL